MPGTIHQCQGQEATAVGVCAALGSGRLHHLDLPRPRPRPGQGADRSRRCSFELFGAATGCCRGKGGSMHVGDMDKGMVPGIAIVGGGIPLAAGMALAFKMQKRPGVVACFFGDGAVAEGAFHEGVNLAAIWDLPVDLRLREQPLRRLDPHRPGDANPAHRRPGRVLRHPRARRSTATTSLAVYEAAKAAASPSAAAGKGPVLLELLTYRRTGHSPPRRAATTSRRTEREGSGPRATRSSGSPALPRARAASTEAGSSASRARKRLSDSRRPWTGAVARRCRRPTTSTTDVSLRSPRRRPTSHEAPEHRRGAARGDRRGDGARPGGLLHGRGHRACRAAGEARSR